VSQLALKFFPQDETTQLVHVDHVDHPAAAFGGTPPKSAPGGVVTIPRGDFGIGFGGNRISKRE